MFAVRERTAPPFFAASRHVVAAEAFWAEAGVLEPVDGLVEHLLHLHLFFLLGLLLLFLQSSVRGVTQFGLRDGQRRHGHQRSTDSSDPPHKRNFWKRKHDHLLQYSKQRSPSPRRVDVEDLHRGHELLDLPHGVSLNPFLCQATSDKRCLTHPGGKHLLIVAKRVVHSAGCGGCCGCCGLCSDLCSGFMYWFMLLFYCLFPCCLMRGQDQLGKLTLRQNTLVLTEKLTAQWSPPVVFCLTPNWCSLPKDSGRTIACVARPGLKRADTSLARAKAATACATRSSKG